MVKYIKYVDQKRINKHDNQPEIDSISCAIQDRQSVISFAKNIKLKLVKDMPYSTKAISISIEEEIRSLTQQIDYLKSKL